MTLDFALNWPFQTTFQALLLPGPAWGWSQELYSCKWSHKLFQAQGRGKKSPSHNTKTLATVKSWERQDCHEELGAPLLLSWEKWVRERHQPSFPVLFEEGWGQIFLNGCLFTPPKEQYLISVWSGKKGICLCGRKWCPFCPQNQMLSFPLKVCDGKMMIRVI